MDSLLQARAPVDVALCPGGFFAATLANEWNRYDELAVIEPSGRVSARIERSGYDLGFTAISPDGMRVAAIEYCDGGTVDVRAWEVVNGRELWHFHGPELGQTNAYRFDLAFSADGKRLAAAYAASLPGGQGLGTELRVWDATTGRQASSSAAAPASSRASPSAPMAGGSPRVSESIPA